MILGYKVHTIALRRAHSALALLTLVLLLTSGVGLPVSAAAFVVPTSLHIPLDIPLAPVDQARILSQVSPAIVDINTTLGYRGLSGAGTGIILDPTGEVLTNNHVIAGATDINAVSLADGRAYAVDVIGYDRTNDIALLRLRGGADLPTVVTGTSSRLTIGDDIAAIGNAGGTVGAPSFSPGHITELGASVRASDETGGGYRELHDVIRLAADIRPGDSGGPLVNSVGEVIGVTVAATLTYRIDEVRGGEGFAIPIDKALAIAEQIRAGIASDTVHIGSTAFMGVSIVDARSSDDRPLGAIVLRVVSDTPAHAIGLREGDVITAIDAVPISLASDVSQLINQHLPGDVITVDWLDEAGIPRSRKLVLASGPVR